MRFSIANWLTFSNKQKKFQTKFKNLSLLFDFFFGQMYGLALAKTASMLTAGDTVWAACMNDWSVMPFPGIDLGVVNVSTAS